MTPPNTDRLIVILSWIGILLLALLCYTPLARWVFA